MQHEPTPMRISSILPGLCLGLVLCAAVHAAHANPDRLPDDAERILLQASPPHLYRAIKLNIDLYRFTRALDLAVKYKQHLDIVLAYRDRYLTQFNKVEGDAKFLTYKAEVNIHLIIM